MKYLLGMVLLLLAMHEGRGQLYPVRGTATLAPPYTLYLADYASPVSQAAVVNLFLADITETDYKVRLDVSIQGVGITLKTKPGLNLRPIVLQGGSTNQLTGVDLEPCFNPQNLDFYGLTHAGLMATGGRLPEGIYEFCFQVYDYHRGIPVSAKFCASAWIFLNDPPMLNMPLDRARVTVQEPQFLRFQWTPMHRHSVNAAFDTEYTLYIKEFTQDDVAIDPYELMKSPIRTIHTITTDQTSFVYDIDEPALTPGKRYAFAVEARDKTGRDMFKNRGLSEVHVFTYGEVLASVDGITGKALNDKEAEFGWAAAPGQTRYAFRYRKTGASAWSEKEQVLNTLKLGNLQSNTTYEFQVRASYGIAGGPWSETRTVKTLIASQTPDFACGAAPAAWNLENTELLPFLGVGDTLYAADFEVVTTSVYGSDGVFSGEGIIELPFMNQHLKTDVTDPKVKMLVTFSDINVNTDRRMIVGNLNVKSSGVQITSDDVASRFKDLIDAVDGTLEFLESEYDDLASLGLYLTDDQLESYEGMTSDGPDELMELPDLLNEGKKLVAEGKNLLRKGDETGIKKVLKGLVLIRKAKALADALHDLGEFGLVVYEAAVQLKKERKVIPATEEESDVDLGPFMSVSQHTVTGAQRTARLDAVLSAYDDSVVQRMNGDLFLNIIISELSDPSRLSQFINELEREARAIKELYERLKDEHKTKEEIVTAVKNSMRDYLIEKFNAQKK